MSASIRIAETVLWNVRISTVEIPAHRAIGLLPYETMIFGGQCDEQSFRDASEVDARARHEEVVHRVLEMCVQPYKQFVARMRELAVWSEPVEDWLIDNALDDLDAGLAELGIVQDLGSRNPRDAAK
jgi:hypothetical protein